MTDAEPLKAPPAQPQGYWLLKPGDPDRDVAEQMLRSPKIVGLTIRVPWSEVNPKPREFHFREIEENLDLCRKVKKPAKLLIQTGRDGLSPSWLPGQWLGSGGKSAPAPWSPQLADAYATLMDSIGTRFRRDTTIVANHITGPTWPSAEMHPMPGLKHQKGYSVMAMREAWRDAAISANLAFPHLAGCLSISVQREADSYVRDVIGLARSIYGERLCIQHNALAADTGAQAGHHLLIQDCCLKGIKVGFEMVCAACDDPVRFGSRNVMDGITVGRRVGGSWFDIYPRPKEVAALKVAA